MLLGPERDGAKAPVSAFGARGSPIIHSTMSTRPFDRVPVLLPDAVVTIDQGTLPWAVLVVLNGRVLNCRLPTITHQSVVIRSRVSCPAWFSA